MENIKSVTVELVNHINDKIADGVIDEFNYDDWLNLAFNEDYYIIGYYNGRQWLKRHDIDSLDAAADVAEYQENILGDVDLKPCDLNHETIVNLYVYAYADNLLNELNVGDYEGFCEALDSLTE